MRTLATLTARIATALAVIALIATPALVTPAFAQKKTDDERKADAERRKQEDRAYRSSIQNIPEQNQGMVDPWNNMRGEASSDGKKTRR